MRNISLRTTAFLLCLLLIAGASSACGISAADAQSGQTPETESAAEPESIESEEETLDETASPAAKEDDAKSAASEPTAAEPVTEEAGAFSFADLRALEFVFSSGAGAWSTQMRIAKDGAFTGNFHDSNMGESGPGYEYGTVYYCDFHGRFAEPVKINAYTYETHIEELSFANALGEQEIQDKILYIASAAYGLEGGETFRIFLPTAPIGALPEDFKDWTRWSIPGYMDNWNVDEARSELPDNTALGFYGFYNVEAQEGFSSYPAYLTTDELHEALADTETRAGEMQHRLETEDLPQQAMNQLAFELFDAWDDQLNAIWTNLSAEMDPEAFAALREEQVQWIHEKEAAAEEAAALYSGGSIAPLLYSAEETEWTKKRVYELMEYLQ